MSDVNWFFSACAQTAGAIVAIVGGFLVTRLVSLGSERNGLLQSLAAVEQRLKVACDTQVALRKKATLQEEAGFRSVVIPDIVEKRGAFDLGLLLQQHYEFNLEKGQLQQIAEDVARCVRDACKILSQLPNRDLANREFEEIALALGDTIPSEERDIYQEVFREEQQRARDKEWSSLDRLTNGVPNIPIISFKASQIEAIEEADLKRHLHEASVAVTHAELERETIQQQLRKTSTPKGLLPAWFILLYLSIVGVGVPLALLPAGACALGWRTPVLVLFLIGLASLLVYFVLTLRAMRETNHNARH